MLFIIKARICLKNIGKLQHRWEFGNGDEQVAEPQSEKIRWKFYLHGDRSDQQFATRQRTLGKCQVQHLS
jgi:hypothetical protein